MIPIFVITYDRLEVLKKTIESYNQIKGNYKIIIYDNGTTYKPTLAYLEELSKNGIQIIRSNKKNMPEEFNSMKEDIKKIVAKYKARYYIVADCDVALNNINGDILEFYSYILTHKRNTCVVGPMLEINDIPNYYPLRINVLSRHSMFWQNPNSIAFNGKNYLYQTTNIDTTFAMYRGDYPFKRMQKGIRTFAPYSALHLDWYINPRNMTEDQKYYSQSASKHISNWGKI